MNNHISNEVVTGDWFERSVSIPEYEIKQNEKILDVDKVFTNLRHI
jgi:hypothetical protein